MLLGVAGSVVVATNADLVGLIVAGFVVVVAVVLSYMEVMRKNEP